MFLHNLTEGISWVGWSLRIRMHTVELINVLIIFLEIKCMCLNAVVLYIEAICFYLKCIIS